MKLEAYFPSDQIDPKKKDKAWHKLWLEAIYNHSTNEAGFHDRREKFFNLRRYARGEQEIADYGPVIGINEADMESGEAWKKIDWTPLKITKKFVRILVNEMTSRHTDLLIDLINEEGREEIRKKESDANAYMLHEQLFKDVSQVSGVQVSKPLPPNVPSPTSPEETKDIMTMYAPHPAIVEMKDKIEKAFKINNWEEIAKKVSKDLVEVGLGGTRTKLGNNTFAPKIEPVVPENLLLPDCRYDDFRDAWYMGELISVTIAELRRMDYNNELTEKDFLTIAQNKSSEKYGRFSYSDIVTFYRDHSYYPYDEQKVDIVYGEWISSDMNVYQTKTNKQGNKTTKRKPYDWYDHEKAKDEYKKKYTDREVIVESEPNIYTGIWVCETDHVINWGMQESMEKIGKDDYSRPRFSFKLYTTEKSSFVEEIMPNIDNMMVNWYQMQHHQMQTRPDGIAVDIDSMLAVTAMTGKGGEGGLTWQENIRMFKAIGSVLYKTVDNALGGTPSVPITPIPGGMGQAAKDHYEAVIAQIQMIAEVTGLTPQVSAGQVDPKTGKAVSEMLASASASAFSHLTRAYDKIYEETAQRIAHLISETTRSRKFSKARNYFNISPIVRKYEYEVSIDPALTNYQREMLARHVEMSLQQQLLLPEQAILIQKQKSLDKSIHLLLRFRREAEEKQARMAQQNSRMQMEQNQASQQQALEEKIAVIRAEIEGKTAMSREEYAHKEKLRAMELEHERLLEELRNRNENLRAAAKIEGELEKASMKTPKITE